MKALMSLIWKSPQSSRQSDISGGETGRGGACIPISASAPAANATTRFSIIAPYFETGSFGET
jgi:hypothetical protein